MLCQPQLLTGTAKVSHINSGAAARAWEVLPTLCTEFRHPKVQEVEGWAELDVLWGNVLVSNPQGVDAPQSLHSAARLGRQQWKT